MKKLLLITFLFLITPDAKADMDYVCRADFDDLRQGFIQKNCERDNILLLTLIPHKSSILPNISIWCRHDREINFIDTGAYYDLTCVLYDNEPRKQIDKWNISK